MAAVILVTVRIGGYDLPSGPPPGMGPPPGPGPPGTAGPPPFAGGPPSGAGPPAELAALAEMRQQAMQLVAVVTRVRPIPSFDAPSSRLTSVAPQLQAIFQCLQILSLAFLKASVLLFYRRLFVTSPRSPFAIATAVLLGGTVAWGLAFFAAGIASCPARLVAGSTPALSNPAVYLCADSLGSSRGGLGPLAGPFAFIVTDVATDFFVLFLPLPVIWGLQMPPRRKLALSAVFLLGGLACVSSVLRLAAFATDIPFGQLGSMSGPMIFGGLSGFNSMMSFWSYLESSLALIAACLPTLRFLFTRQGWTGLRSRGKRLSAKWAAAAGSWGGSTLRSEKGEAARSAPKTAPAPRRTTEWSFSDRSTAARSPSPTASLHGSLAEKKQAQGAMSDPLDAEMAEVRGPARLEEGDVEPVELGDDGTGSLRTEPATPESHEDTAWLRRTVDASRAEQV